jgi:hypothetical protein
MDEADFLRVLKTDHTHACESCRATPGIEDARVANLVAYVLKSAGSRRGLNSSAGLLLRAWHFSTAQPHAHDRPPKASDRAG